MARANTSQTNFTTGEISPLMRGRVDTVKYVNGAEELLNFIVLPQGGAWRRPGSEYIGTMADQSKEHVIIPFQFSTTQAYILEFGDTTLRIWADDALVDGQDAKYIESISAEGGEIEILSTAHGYDTGDQVVIQETDGLDFDGTWTITKTSDDEFTLDGSTHAAGWTIGTGWLYRIGDTISMTTPYASADLAELYTTQSADVLWVCHPDYQPYVLRRYGANNWTFEKWEFEDGPYLSSDSSLIRSRIVDIENYSGAFEIHTAGNHRVTDGVFVTIKDVAGCPNANGTWEVERTNPTAFRLKGSTFAGAYTGGGVVEANARVRVRNYSDTAKVYSSTSAHPGFTVGPPTDVGQLIELPYENDWILAEITAVTDTQNATIDILENLVKKLPRGVYLRAKRGNRVVSGPFGVVDPETYVDRDRGDTTSLIVSHSGALTHEDIGKYVRITGKKKVGTPPSIGPVSGETENNWRKLVHSREGKNWTVSAIAAASARDWTYDGATTEIQIYNRTITADVYSDMHLFQSTDVDRLIRLEMSGVWVWGKITAVTDVQSPFANYASVTLYSEPPVDASDAEELANNGIADSFKLGAWSDTTGWPRCATFHEQRIVFAGTAAEPQTVWMSISGDFTNLAPTEEDGTVLDDNAVTYSFASQEVNSIVWLHSGPVLLIGTIGGEWQARAATSIMEPITPSNLSVTPQDNVGAIEDTGALRVGNGVLFLQRNGQKVYDMTYSFELDKWQATDITIIGEHILRKGTKGVEMVYQKQPYSTVWIRTSSGDLVGLTMNRAQEIAAWHFHQLADADSGTANIESIAVIPDSTTNQDVLYMVVQRTINGSTKRFLEKLSAFEYPSSGTDFTGFLHHDCGTKVTVSPAAEDPSATGLAEFNGETLEWIAFLDSLLEADNDYYITGSGEVSAGSLLINTNRDVVQANCGFAFTSRLLTLPIEGGSVYGTAHGKPKATRRFTGRFYMSMDVKVGVSLAALDRIRFNRESGLVSVDKRLQTRGSHELAQGIYLAQDEGIPLVILAIFQEQSTKD